MDILEELYLSYEFYQLLQFRDLQQLRDWDLLGIGDIRWNYSKQAYYRERLRNEYRQYKMDIEVRRIVVCDCSSMDDETHEIWEALRKVGNIVYRWDMCYGTMGYKTANNCLSPSGKVTCYNIDNTGTDNIILKGNKWVKFEDGVIYLDQMKIAGLTLYDLEITPYELMGDVALRNVEPWQHELVEKLTKRKFKPDINGYSRYNPGGPETIRRLPKYEKQVTLMTDIPEYPTISLLKIITDPNYKIDLETYFPIDINTF